MSDFFQRATHEILRLDPSPENPQLPVLRPDYDPAWFIPSYPPIGVDDFSEEIVSKKELWDVRDPYFLPHQVRISRFLSDHSTYDSLLLFHDPGTGKSSVAIAVLDALKTSNSIYRNGPVFIVANNATIVNNFKEQIKIHSMSVRDTLVKLTESIQDPERRAIRMRDGWSSAFSKMNIKFFTYYQLHKEINTNPDIMRSSNVVLIMDECHHLRFSKGNTIKEQVYWDIHAFVHQIQKKKMLLLTGTPMQDQPEEVALLWNLMLPMNQQLPIGPEFIRKYFNIEKKINVAMVEETDITTITTTTTTTVGEEEEGQGQQQEVDVVDNVLLSYQWKEEEIHSLATLLSPRISYVKQRLSNVNIVYRGEITAPMVSLPIFRDAMSDFQTEYYGQAILADESGGTGNRRRGSGGGGGISTYDNRLQASLFVYPDGSWGKQGFQRFIRFSIQHRSAAVEDDEALERLMVALREPFEIQWVSDPSPIAAQYPDMTTAIRRSAEISVDEKIRFLSQFSSVYASFLREFLDDRNLLKKAYAYSFFVEGSGMLVLALILRDLFGFEMITRASPSLMANKTSKDRFIFINDVVRTPDKDVQELLQFFNQDENKTGRLCRLILSTNKTTEGISLMHIRQIHILTPKWNFAEITQAIARGLRQGSHEGLRDPTVNVYLHCAVPGGQYSTRDANELSIDFQRYLVSEVKDRNIALIRRFFLTTSWDCVYEFPRNSFGLETMKEDSRECEYGECRYSCWPWDKIPENESQQQQQQPEPKNVLVDSSNSVAWYDTLRYRHTSMLLREYFRKHSYCTQDALYEFLSSGCIAEDMNQRQQPLSGLTPFEFMDFMSMWISDRLPLYTIYGTAVLLDYIEPFYFVHGYVPGTSGIPEENIVLETYADRPFHLFSYGTAAEMIQSDWDIHNDDVINRTTVSQGFSNADRVRETIHDLAFRIVSLPTNNKNNKDAETMKTRIDDLLRLLYEHIRPLLVQLLENYLDLLVRIGPTADSTPPFHPKLDALVLILQRCQAVFSELPLQTINIPNLNQKEWWKTTPLLSFTMRHSLLPGVTRSRDPGATGAWTDHPESTTQPSATTTTTTSVVPKKKKTATTTYQKPLPHEEMNEEELSKWIFDNPVGFYAFKKDGDLFLRDVRNRELYRLTDRKKIPQGKKCTSFNAGELMYICLRALRMLSVEDAEDMIRQTHLFLPSRSLPRTQLETSLCNSSFFNVFKKQIHHGIHDIHDTVVDENDIDNNTILQSLSEEELRLLLAISSLKILPSKKITSGGGGGGGGVIPRTTTICDFIITLFQKINLWKN